MYSSILYIDYNNKVNILNYSTVIHFIIYKYKEEEDGERSQGTTEPPKNEEEPPPMRIVIIWSFDHLFEE